MTEQSSTSTQEPGLVAGHTLLKSDIGQLILPYFDTLEKPPFSAAEMTVMAIIHSDDEWLTQRQVLTWILRYFKYYGNLALSSYVDTLKDSDNHRFAHPHSMNDNVVPYFKDCFKQYLTPLISKDDDFERGDVTVDVRAARIFLNKHFSPARRRPFEFLKLPAEIRNCIYEFVLLLPSGGIDVAGHRVMDRVDGPNKHHLREWKGIDELRHKKESENIAFPARLLSLLAVNRQIRTEAMPIFWGSNELFFNSIQRFDILISRFDLHGRDLLKYLSKIYLKFAMSLATHGDVACWEEATLRLANHASLELLIFETHDEDWRSITHRQWQQLGCSKQPKQIRGIPGFRDLAKAVKKAEKFELLGRCPRVGRFLDLEVANLEKEERAQKMQVKASATSFAQIDQDRDGAGSKGQPICID